MGKSVLLKMKTNKMLSFKDEKLYNKMFFLSVYIFILLIFIRYIQNKVLRIKNS